MIIQTPDQILTSRPPVTPTLHSRKLALIIKSIGADGFWLRLRICCESATNGHQTICNLPRRLPGFCYCWLGTFLWFICCGVFWLKSNNQAERNSPLTQLWEYSIAARARLCLPSPTRRSCCTVSARPNVLMEQQFCVSLLCKLFWQSLYIPYTYSYIYRTCLLPHWSTNCPSNQSGRSHWVVSVRAVLGRAECGGASVTYQLALFRELRCGSAALPCYLERAKGCNAPHTLTRHGKNPTASTVRCSTTTTCDGDKARVAAKRDSGNSASTLNWVNPTTNIFMHRTHSYKCMYMFTHISSHTLYKSRTWCFILCNQ